MKPKFNLQEGVEHLIENIKEAKKNKDGNLVVLIAGGSSSGKTSQVAKKVVDFYEKDAILLSMDNYYRGRKYVEENNLNFDQPEALDLKLFFEDLTKLKSGQTVLTPKYDFVNSRQIPNMIEIKPKKIIVVEGLFALTEDVEKLGDIKVFIDLSEHGRIFRRIFRDVERTKEKPKQILDYFLDIVEPMNDKYIDPTKKNADFIIINEFDPIIETSQLKAKDYQKKFDLKNHNAENIGEIIISHGAQYLGNFIYTDYYFTPNYLDEKSPENEEIVFIRNIDFGKNILIYKSPLSENEELEERYTMNFLIDSVTLDAMRRIYGNDILILKRKRQAYFYYGILIFIDIFENGEQILEFKFADRCANTQETIDKIISLIN